jgi:hypothetical protein
LWKKGYLSQIINTDHKGRGVHWLQASAHLLPDQPKVRILEAIGDKGREQISAHVEKIMKATFPGNQLTFIRTGAQLENDGSHCGHISTWYQLCSSLALTVGMNVSSWEPEPPPKYWFDVVSELLRIRDDQNRLDLRDLDFESIGLTPYFTRGMNGVGTIHEMLVRCRQYRAQLAEMRDTKSDRKDFQSSEMATKATRTADLMSADQALKQDWFDGELKPAYPNDDCFDQVELKPTTQSCVSPHNSGDDYIDSDAREDAEIQSMLMDLISSDDGAEVDTISVQKRAVQKRGHTASGNAHRKKICY